MTDPRAALEAERAEASSRLDDLARELAAIVEAARDVATDDEHDPEGATIGYERARTTALADQARAQVAAVDAALDRLDAGTYGTCERCGRPIGDARLEARPTATTCITCASTAR